MDSVIQVCSYVVGLSLEILVISVLLRGGFRRYPLCFVYLIADFVATVAEIPASIAYYSGTNTKILPRLYWIDEGVREALLFAVVISLIYFASAKLGTRRVIRLALIIGGVVFIGISFLVHYDGNAKLGIWMTPWIRDMKVCATVLDLALWALLIGWRKVDQQLLLLSGALGILFTGGAIGESIRTIATRSRSHGLSTMGGVLVLLVSFLFYFIWWQAFRKESPAKVPSGSVRPVSGR